MSWSFNVFENMDRLWGWEMKNHRQHVSVKLSSQLICVGLRPAKIGKTGTSVDGFVCDNMKIKTRQAVCWTSLIKHTHKTPAKDKNNDTLGQTQALRPTFIIQFIVTVHLIGKHRHFRWSKSLLRPYQDPGKGNAWVRCLLSRWADSSSPLLLP